MQFSLQICLICIYAASQGFCIGLNTNKGICCTLWRTEKGKEEQVQRGKMGCLGLPTPQAPAFLPHCFLHCMSKTMSKLCYSQSQQCEYSLVLQIPISLYFVPSLKISSRLNKKQLIRNNCQLKEWRKNTEDAVSLVFFTELREMASSYPVFLFSLEMKQYDMLVMPISCFKMASDHV